jgi:lipopolysaccharide assembly outer membrane protein LptD (OstA)
MHIFFVLLLLIFCPQSLIFAQESQDFEKMIERLGWTEVQCEKLTFHREQKQWRLSQIQIHWKHLSIKADELVIQENQGAWQIEGKGNINIEHQEGNLKADQIKFNSDKNQLYLEGNIKGKWQQYQIEAQKIALDLLSLDFEIQNTKIQFQLKDLLKFKTIKS